MKITLLGHRDIASNVALSLIVTRLPQHDYRIMLSGDVASAANAPPQLVELARFEAGLCDQLTDASRRHDLQCLHSFDALAAQAGSPVQTLAAPNSAEGLRLLESSDPDLIVSVRYRRILRDQAIGIARFGVLNLHSGLLPDYKGMMATFHAMLNGEREIGSTLHFIVDATIDTGPIVGRAAIPVDAEQSYLANVLSLYPPGCEMVVSAIEKIDRGEAVTGQSQQEKGHYYSAPDRADIARFQRKGLRLYDGDELHSLANVLPGPR